jgi:hypothetical protein
LEGGRAVLTSHPSTDYIWYETDASVTWNKRFYKHRKLIMSYYSNLLRLLVDVYEFWTSVSCLKDVKSVLWFTVQVIETATMCPHPI